MERNVNYMIVGFVVLVALAGIGVFASWVIGGLDKNTYKSYTIIFHDAVTGLNENSPVEYKGVRVGQVTAIILDAKKPDIVQVNMKVKEKTPIQSYTDVSLGIQNITGLSNIELDTPIGEPSPPQKRDGFPYPVLDGSSRQLGKLIEDLPRIAEKILSVTEKIDNLLDDKTMGDLQQSIKNMERLTTDFNGLLSTQNVNSFSRTLENTEQVSKNFADIGKSFDRTAREIDKVAQTLSDAIKSNEKSLNKFTQQGLDQVLSLARESRDMAQHIGELAESIKENPSQLIYQQKENTVRIAP